MRRDVVSLGRFGFGGISGSTPGQPSRNNRTSSGKTADKPTARYVHTLVFELGFCAHIDPFFRNPFLQSERYELFFINTIVKKVQQ